MYIFKVWCPKILIDFTCQDFHSYYLKFVVPFHLDFRILKFYIIYIFLEIIMYPIIIILSHKVWPTFLIH